MVRNTNFAAICLINNKIENLTFDAALWSQSAVIKDNNLCTKPLEFIKSCVGAATISKVSMDRTDLQSDGFLKQYIHTAPLLIFYFSLRGKKIPTVLVSRT